MVYAWSSVKNTISRTTSIDRSSSVIPENDGGGAPTCQRRSLSSRIFRIARMQLGYPPRTPASTISSDFMYIRVLEPTFQPLPCATWLCIMAGKLAWPSLASWQDPDKVRT